MKYVLLLLLIFTPMNVHALDDVNKAQTRNTKPDIMIRKVESYLNGLGNATANFTQISGEQTRGGLFYLSRPGKLRFEYDAPQGEQGDFIVADSRFIFYYDAELEQQSNTLISGTLANFILRDDISLQGDILVTKIDENKNENTVTLTLLQTENPSAGSLKLTFDKDPLKLRKWNVIDGQGFETLIELTDLKTGMVLDRDLFFYRDPKRGTFQYNEE